VKLTLQDAYILDCPHQAPYGLCSVTDISMQSMTLDTICYLYCYSVFSVTCPSRSTP